jgi:triacylglycerol lipase
MKKIIFLCIVFGLMLTALSSQEGSQTTFTSRYPIVLVHGFGGWGPDELVGYKYWGGTALDIQQYLRDRGFEVYTTSVGPITSNHDRACELYFQIKGGRVDYGAEHAKKYGHNRMGREYQGLYPKWDQDNPIHLIGHSMGGQTCRMLAELLEANSFGAHTSAVWVKSVTTISTPNNGTTLATIVNKFAGGYAEEIVARFLALAGANWEVYDFDLDQWNLVPKPGETLHTFLKRVDETLGNTKDISLYDLLPQGAQDLNQKIRTLPNIYYFSVATEETYVLDPIHGFELGEPAMNPMFWLYAYHMGCYEGSDVSPHKAWWQNDGVVNTISMQGPFNARIESYQGKPQPGVWNFMGVIESKDHGKIIGHYQFSGRWLQKFYTDLATTLYKLP